MRRVVYADWIIYSPWWLEKGVRWVFEVCIRSTVDVCIDMALEHML